MIKLLIRSFDSIESKHKLLLSTIFVLGIIISLFEILSIGIIFPILELLVYDDLEDSKFYNIISNIYTFENKKFFLLFIGSSAIFIFIFKNILLVFSKYLKDKLLFNLRNGLDVDFFYEYLKKNVMFHKNTNTSKLITNLNSEISIFIKSILLGTLELLSCFVIILFSLIMIWFVNYYIVIFIIILIGVLYIFVVRIFRNKVKALGEQRSKYTTERLKIIQESFNSIIDVKINFLEKTLSNQLKNVLVKISRTKIYIYLISYLPQVISEIIIILLVFGAFIFAINNNLDIKNYLPEIGLLFLTFVKISPTANKCINYINGIAYAAPIVEKLFDDIGDLKNKHDHDNDNMEIKKLNFKNYISFNSVTYGYDSKSLFLNNLNFKIKKNSIVGIIGSSGSGKTTILNLLIGFFNPISGEIFVDDQNINNLDDHRSWLANIGYVPQNSFIFDDTIYNNISLGFSNDNRDEQKLKSALEKSQLVDFTKNLKNGLNTPLGELGSKISGGQKQRIALARVLYQNKDIIILDEATNSLDKKTELKFLENLKKLKDKKTIIIVSHDIGVMDICDNIFEIKNQNIYKVK